MTERPAGPRAPGVWLGRPLGRPRWGIVVIGYLLALGAGWGYGATLRATGHWDLGAPWERSVLAAVDAATPDSMQQTLFLVPWAGTNLTLGPLVAILGAWLLRQKRRDLALWIVTVELGVLSLVWLVKELLGRERPTITARVGWYGLASYPSGHAMASLAVLVTLALMARRAGRSSWPLWITIALCLAVAYSRLLHGVHWPSDLIGGALIGAIWLGATWLAFERLPDRSATDPA